jgi:hypothetical protein
MCYLLPVIPARLIAGKAGQDVRLVGPSPIPRTSFIVLGIFFQEIRSHKDGRNMASLQVKTSGKKVRFWPTPKPEKILSGKQCHYVFVRYIEDEEDFDAFLVSGREVNKQVAANEAYYRKTGKKEFPYFSIDKKDEAAYRKDWEEFTL